MKKWITILIILAMITWIACTKGGKLERIAGESYAVNATASSKQLVPAIDTTSTGTLTGFYDAQANILTYTITWNDLWRDTKKDTIVSVSFYGPATASANGTLVRSLPFVNLNRAGTVNLGLAGITGFTAEEKKNFLAGAYYFTIDTKRYPNGIVRGQLTATKK
ncbi:MAG: CHRD domain-containing protein [Williamsia sp.]|nr:CHRD domain-containing protein [Williamsia sp.]